MKLLTKIRRWTWELPQTLVGACLLPFYKKSTLKVMEFGDTKAYFSSKFPGGISLGYYVFIGWKGKTKLTNPSMQDTIGHECFGHGTQSKWLGPLYLPVIGLQSITWAALYGTLVKPTKNGYYKFWTEKWADKIAGIVRK